MIVPNFSIEFQLTQNALMRGPLSIFISFSKTKKNNITYFLKSKKNYPSSKRSNSKKTTPIHTLPKLKRITNGQKKISSRDSQIPTNSHNSINSNSGCQKTALDYSKIKELQSTAHVPLIIFKTKKLLKTFCKNTQQLVCQTLVKI